MRTFAGATGTYHAVVAPHMTWLSPTVQPTHTHNPVKLFLCRSLHVHIPAGAHGAQPHAAAAHPLQQVQQPQQPGPGAAAAAAAGGLPRLLLGGRPVGDSSMPDFPSGGLDLVQHLNLDGIFLEQKVGFGLCCKAYSMPLAACADGLCCLVASWVKKQRSV